MFHPKPGFAAYHAAKYGVVGLSEINRGLLPQGVRVTTLCPGGIGTPWWRAPDGQCVHPSGAENLMQPDEVAELVDFIIRQPKRTLYKQLWFFPSCEWR